ncbi:hypothetical protein BCR35DRAFT_324456 [Leucosporidium creatinivorum]|uniref:Uncharacterized protein n=1 Tax=Leucosporidium creatinivorum TaxID=106004 RepID=A0A1Y2FTQ3_9BASI|nr:hypothetical protein BCR35DRAFT_324456 [Leucosporidium creatinivorum]
MGLAYFEQTCPGSDITTKTVQAWCVLKEGTCCAVCPNNLATVGSRVGLIALTLFATLVVVYDAAEAPYNFLTVSMSSVAYLVAILQAGLRGGQISKFHAYYALFASLGFLSPLAAISVSPNSYLYGESHPKLGKKLLPFSRKMGRRSESATKATVHSLGHALGLRRYRQLGDPSQELHSLAHGDPEPHFPAPRRAATDTMLGRARVIPSSSRRGVSSFWTSNRTENPSRVAERRPLADTDPFRIGDTSTETSPVIHAGSPRFRRGEMSEGEPPEVLLPGAMLPLSAASPLSRSHTLPPSHAPLSHHVRQPSPRSTFFDDASSISSHRSSGEEEDEIRPHAQTSALVHDPHHHSSSTSEREHEHGHQRDIRWENPRPAPQVPQHQHGHDHRRNSSDEITAAPPPREHGISADTTLIPSHHLSPRRKLTKRRRSQHEGQPPPLPTTPHRAPPLTEEENDARRAVHSVELTEEDKEYIYQKMQGSAWRRRSYIGGNFALWTLWLVTFLLVAGIFPANVFTFSQTDSSTAISFRIRSTAPSPTAELTIASLEPSYPAHSRASYSPSGKSSSGSLTSEQLPLTLPSKPPM